VLASTAVIEAAMSAAESFPARSARAARSWGNFARVDWRTDGDSVVGRKIMMVVGEADEAE